MGQGDSALLTSGRDSVIRLWDTRMLSPVPSDTRSKRSLLMEFHDHKCHSYNISCTFFSDDRAVATGSEDKKVWVYDAKTGEVLKTLEGHGSVVHFLATPRSQSYNNLQLASSSIDSNEVNIWSPAKYKTECGVDCDMDEEEDDAFTCFRRMSSLESNAGVSRRPSIDSRGEAVGGAGDHLLSEDFDSNNEDDEMMDAQLVSNQINNNLVEMHRLAIESLMQKHGDLILRIFHACDYSFRTHIDWRSLIRHLTTRMNSEGQPVGPNGDEEGSHVSGFDPESVAEAVMEMATIFSNIAEEQNSLGQQQQGRIL
jgi:WD40 repeat protein